MGSTRSILEVEILHGVVLKRLTVQDAQVEIVSIRRRFSPPLAPKVIISGPQFANFGPL